MDGGRSEARSEAKPTAPRPLSGRSARDVENDREAEAIAARAAGSKGPSNRVYFIALGIIAVLAVLVFVVTRTPEKAAAPDALAQPAAPLAFTGGRVLAPPPAETGVEPFRALTTAIPSPAAPASSPPASTNAPATSKPSPSAAPAPASPATSAPALKPKPKPAAPPSGDDIY